MNQFLAVLSGIVIAIMVMMNGELGNAYGNYYSTVFIHLSGLLVISLILLLKKRKLAKPAGIPWYFFTGGCIGVFTVISNILAVMKLDLSLTIALGVLGQLLAALAVDYFGLLGAIKQKFEWNKVIGILVIALGIGAMVLI